VQIGDRERVTIDAVSGLELSLEIGNPDVVGRGGHGRNHAGRDIAGNRNFIHWRIFLGPHVGWRRRASQMLRATNGSMRWEQVLGARLRSTRPWRPSFSKRTIHL
jgi:hypothetical protein